MNNWVYILDYANGKIYRIHWDTEVDFENIDDVLGKYSLRIKDCDWMVLDHKENMISDDKTLKEPVTKEIGGSHYQSEIQPWDFIAANKLGFDEGNIVKYICRHQKKNGAEDIKKAISYCKHILKTQYNDTYREK